MKTQALLLSLFLSYTALNASSTELKPLFLNQGEELLHLNFDDNVYDETVTVPGESTRWKVENKQLVGIPSTPEYQASKTGHNGSTPITTVTIPGGHTKVIAKLDFMFEAKTLEGKAYVSFGYPIAHIHWGKDAFSVASGNSNDLMEGANLEPGKWYTLLAEVYGEEMLMQMPGLRPFYVKNEHLLELVDKPTLKVRGFEQCTTYVDNIRIYKADGIQSDWNARKDALIAATNQVAKSNKLRGRAKKEFQDKMKADLKAQGLAKDEINRIIDEKLKEIAKGDKKKK